MSEEIQLVQGKDGIYRVPLSKIDASYSSNKGFVKGGSRIEIVCDNLGNPEYRLLINKPKINCVA